MLLQESLCTVVSMQHSCYNKLIVNGVYAMSHFSSVTVKYLCISTTGHCNLFVVYKHWCLLREKC